jgi:dihydropteroate synthase
MSRIWRCRDRAIETGARALVMGIVNVTPDSFSDGGQHDTTDKAIQHALKLIADGADILDVGGESSRPGALPVPLEEELRRVIPVVCELARQTSVPISIDTVKAAVALESLQSGACIINDITALRGDSIMADVVRDYGAGLVLMHMQGEPATMHLNPCYGNVVEEVGAFFEERFTFCRAARLDPASIALDPGIGFGKTNEHSLHLLRKLGEFQRFGRPVCLGVSRKGLIGEIVNRPREQRLAGSVALACFAVTMRSAQIVRVHDVAEHVDAMRILEALV